MSTKTHQTVGQHGVVISQLSDVLSFCAWHIVQPEKEHKTRITFIITEHNYMINWIIELDILIINKLHLQAALDLKQNWISYYHNYYLEWWNIKWTHRPILVIRMTQQWVINGFVKFNTFNKRIQVTFFIICYTCIHQMLYALSVGLL